MTIYRPARARETVTSVLGGAACVLIFVLDAPALIRVCAVVLLVLAVWSLFTALRTSLSVGSERVRYENGFRRFTFDRSTMEARAMQVSRGRSSAPMTVVVLSAERKPEAAISLHIFSDADEQAILDEFGLG